MRFKYIHKDLLLLILGVFSFLYVLSDCITNPNIFIQTEIEESLDEIDEVDFEIELSDSDSGTGGSAIVSAQNTLIKIPLSGRSDLRYSQSKDLSQKPHLFILYCCLKLDC